MHFKIKWHFLVRVLITSIKLENEINEFVKYNYKNTTIMEVFIDLYILTAILNKKKLKYVEYLSNNGVSEENIGF